MNRCAGRTRPLPAVVALVAVLAACTAGDDDDMAARSSAPARSATPSPSTTPIASAAATPSAAPTPSSAVAPEPVPTVPASALPTVPARPVRTLPPVPLTSPAAADDGIVVRLAGTTSVTTAGRGPGESSGEPATAFTLRVANRGSAPLDLATATVHLYAGSQRTPARQSEGPPARPLQGTVPAGGSAEGVYVFVVPPGGRSDVELTVDFSVDQPIVVLSGPLP